MKGQRELRLCNGGQHSALELFHAFGSGTMMQEAFSGIGQQLQAVKNVLALIVFHAAFHCSGIENSLLRLQDVASRSRCRIPA